MHALQEVRRAERRVRRSMFVLIAGCALASGAASATSFPVSGTISVNGNPGTLPSGGSFGPNSSYDAASGAIAAGRFMFPVATTVFYSSVLGANVTVTYQLSQTNTSTGQVASDGIAALGAVTMKLQVLSATVGVVPIGVGTCIFQPIDLALAGSGAASGLDLADTGFAIPPVAPTDCGGWGSQINSGIAGSNNSLQTHWTGNFTPPTGNDLIFANGFDPG